MGASNWAATAAELLLGATCLVCGDAAWGVCAGCRAELTERAPFRVAPDPRPAGFPLTFAASGYDEALRALIVAHKERQVLALTPLLGALLHRSVEALLADWDAPAERTAVLVPVPSARAAVRARGFDAIRAMARATTRSRASGAGTSVGPVRLVVGSWVSQRPGVLDQAELSAAERRRNVAGAFRVADRTSAAPLIVVDDLVTTGSTLAAVTSALTAAGLPVLGAATVAAAARRSRRPGTAAPRPAPEV